VYGYSFKKFKEENYRVQTPVPPKETKEKRKLKTHILSIYITKCLNNEVFPSSMNAPYVIL
jgi:hypothetical protein